MTAGEQAGSFSARFEAEAVKPDPEEFSLIPYEPWQKLSQSNVVLLPVELSMEAAGGAERGPCQDPGTGGNRAPGRTAAADGHAVPAVCPGGDSAGGRISGGDPGKYL